MIATCQFCKELIRGPERAEVNSDEARAYEYRQLSMLVSWHMSEKHRDECANEMTTTMALAGAAFAMRYVMLSDGIVEEWRDRTGRALMETFDPSPPSRVNSLQAATADEPVSEDSAASAL
ncbi:MAG TPA: hypothetical protein VKT12_04630 [Candidatus Binataceae bacterium]|nr:hypothetical protein [Candidatus Binataceae bacterium]